METEDSQRVACKLIYLLKRFTDEWLNKQVCCQNLADFNHAHLPLFMSIGTTGISNNALAEKLNVTKQATSKIIKELEAINMVRSEKSQTDARAVMLFLTSDGEKYYQHVRAQIYALEEQYKKVVGAKNFEIAIDVMLKLIHFHEQENTKKAVMQ